MNLHLTRQYQYVVNKEIGDVRADFSKITNRKWYDLSRNITGTLNADDTFNLTHKWTLGYIRGFGDNHFVHLDGYMVSEGNKTIINTTLKLNSFVIVFFVIMSIILIVISLNSMATLNRLGLLGIAFFISLPIINTLIIQWMANGLRQRFESLLELHSVQ